MKDCPKCSTIVDGLTCRKCGYSEAPVTTQADPDRVTVELYGKSYSLPRCADVDQGLRCAVPGSLSTSTQGGGPLWCAQHFPPFRSRNAFRDATIAGIAKARKAARIKPVDFEGVAERLAIEGELILRGE